MKKCFKCKVSKEKNEFPKRGNLKRFKDGLYSYCKKCKSDTDREYRSRNLKKIITKQKEYFSKPEIKSKRKGYIKNWMKLRRNRRLDIRLMESLRSRLYKAIKGYAKSHSTSILIGCTIDELKLHLEAKFSIGMTWDNYGAWHIDHIRPCSKFDLTDPEQQKICFHYSNLQPLWAIDNLRKRDKYEEVS